MQIEFHFDFGSPNSYLAHRVIPAIQERTRARFRYVPVLLGGVFKATGNRSPIEAFAGIRNKPEYEQLETERLPPPPPDRRLRAQPVLSGEHVADDARGRGGRDQWRAGAVCRSDVPSHVGSTEKNGRSGGIP